MPIRKTLSLAVLFAAAAAVAALPAAAQSLPWNVPFTPGGTTPQQAEARQRLAQNVEAARQLEYMMRMSGSGRGGGGGGTVTVATSSAEIVRKVKKYVAPDAALRAANEAFLRQPNTGLSLLLPAKACVTDDDEKFEKLLRRCPFNFLEGGGSFFSFRARDYVKSVDADLGMRDGWIFSLGMFNQGVLVDLGDVPLADVTRAAKGVDYLAGFTPAVTVADADAQYQAFERGVTTGGYTYQQVLAAAAGRTYALRVIAYRVPVPQTVRRGSRTDVLYPFAGLDRRDVTVAFRILKKESDGSLAILWKELANEIAPELQLPAPEAK